MTKIIWDLPTRILHWAMAFPIALNYFLEGGKKNHRYVGYRAAFVLLLRLMWGFISKGHAHFKNFPMSPKKLFQRNLDYPGHNPQASYVYFGIWTMVLALGVSGFMTTLDAYWGEEWLEELHETFGNILLGLIGLHLTGLGVDSLKFKRKTWKGMITGSRD